MKSADLGMTFLSRQSRIEVSTVALPKQGEERGRHLGTQRLISRMALLKNAHACQL